MHMPNRMRFYVCSFGGCGSWMLAQYLSRYGPVSHVHTRKPPTKLTKVRDEQFTTDAVKPANYRVIYIYRDPLTALCSVARRHDLGLHCHNIGCAPATLEMAVERNADVFGLAEFFTNYTTPAGRNYRILCVKYETLAANMPLLNSLLGIPDVPMHYPTIRETPTDAPDVPCYDALRATMDALPPFYLV